MISTQHRTVGVAATALLASTATLLCCVLPAVLVALGAGAALVGLVSAVPQLIWLSEHKGWVFGVAGVLLLVSGILLWNARRLPCPVEPQAARLCMRLRSLSNWMFAIAVVAYMLGTGFAFLLPALGGS
jgi:hypothetical protein